MRLLLASSLCFMQLEVTEKIPMYGYHSDPQVFFKCYLCNPADVALAAAFLEVTHMMCTSG